MAMSPDQMTQLIQGLMETQRQASEALQTQQIQAIQANQTLAAEAAATANAQLMESMKTFMTEQRKGNATAEQIE